MDVTYYVIGQNNNEQINRCPKNNVMKCLKYLYNFLVSYNV